MRSDSPHMYQTFYRLRRERDLGWYEGSVRQMIAEITDIASVEPLRVLCGIENPGSGWRVYRFQYRERWVEEHTGPSEAAARWQYERLKEDDPAAIMLIDPAHQIVEQEGGSKKDLVVRGNRAVIWTLFGPYAVARAGPRGTVPTR